MAAAVGGPASLQASKRLQRSKKRAENNSSTDIWDTYSFEWLFDVNRIDHLPIEEQLKIYKSRDLEKVKFFKTACKIFGAPASRKRVIIAPPMKREWEDDPISHVKTQQASTSELKPQIPPAKMPTKEQLEEWKSWDKEGQYKSWVAERKAFRKNLESMGLNEEWLARKPNKTALEQRVLRRLIEERNPKPPTPPPKEDIFLEPILPEESPLVRRPSPLAIRIIEKFLQKKKMRLLDLFANVDKQKNWKVSRDDFRKAIQEAKIPISEVLLEDLVLALDTDLDDQLDYRELAMGMGLWKKEKIDSKRRLINSGSLSHSPTKYSQASGFESPGPLDDPQYDIPLSPTKSVSASKSKSSPVPLVPTPHESKMSQAGETSPTPGPSTHRVKSALSTISSTSSHLEPPEPDLRPEQRIMSSEEAMVDLRKRDREALARLTGKKLPSPKQSKQSLVSKDSKISKSSKTIIRTGDTSVDNHMRPSTLTGEVGHMVDKFRMQKHKEYDEVVKLCKERNVPLTEDLLKKVLLYPPDYPHSQIRKHIRQPALHLLSEKFSDPPKQKTGKSPRSERRRQRSQKSTESKSGSKRQGGTGTAAGASGGGEGRAGTMAGQKTIGGSLTNATGSGMIEDYSSLYPPRSALRPQAEKVNLSTGKAVIRSQVNCWMSYEEYEHHTRHLAKKYGKLPVHHGKADDNAFWPGQMLEKMRIYLDHEHKSNSVFNIVRKEKPTNSGYNNNLKTWPINDSGYIQYGTIDK